MQPTAIDLETKGLIDRGVFPEILCWSWANESGSGCSDDFKLLSQYLRECEKLIFHNAKFDVAVLRHHGYRVNTFEDTMLMSYVWNTSRVSHRLESWGKELKHKKLTPPWKGDYPEVFNEEVAEYAKRDAEVTFKLYNYLLSKLDQQDLKVYELEKQFCEIVMDFERLGLPVCESETYQLKDELEHKLLETNAEITAIAGNKVPSIDRKKYKKEHPDKQEYFVKQDGDLWIYDIKGFEDFNHNSIAHRIYALEKIYGWKPKIYTDKGNPKLDTAVMSYLADKGFELAQLFMDSSKYQKVLSTFINPLLNFKDSKGFVHGSYHQARTITGRLSSSRPNLQNLPARGEMGKKMRSLIKSPHEQLVIVQADLSNIEARILAYYLAIVCDDYSLLDIFKSGDDLHQTNANRWGLTRDMAKKVLYLTLYGGTHIRLSKEAGITEEEAQAIHNKFNQKQPYINTLKSQVFDVVKKRGYVKTKYGRKIKYKVNKTNYNRVSRQCFNALLQGTAADILKKLLLDIYDTVKEYGAMMMATVHDEILILANRSNAQELLKELSTIWNNSDYLDPCPIVADFKIGERWSEVK